MHGPGHIGIGLLLSAPLGFELAAAGQPALAILACAVAVAAAVLPDADVYLPIAHRGPTHTIAFVAVVPPIASAAAAVPTVLLGGPAWEIGAVVGVAAAVGAGSHLAADAFTPMGIRPFRPLSSRRYTLNAVPSRHRLLNGTLLVCGVLAVLPVVRQLVA